MSEDLTKLRLLKKRVKEITEDLSLKLVGFAITPGDDSNDPSVLNVAMIVTVEAVETIEQTEQRHVDDDFDAIFAAEFGEGLDFVSDETKELLEKERLAAEKRKADLDAAIKEIEGD